MQHTAGWRLPNCLRQSANLSVETALISSCLVLVDQTLASHVIKNRYSFFERSFCSVFVTGSNSCENALYHGAHHRALAGVTLTRFFGLADAFVSSVVVHPTDPRQVVVSTDQQGLFHSSDRGRTWKETLGRRLDSCNQGTWVAWHFPLPNCWSWSDV